MSINDTGMQRSPSRNFNFVTWKKEKGNICFLQCSFYNNEWIERIFRRQYLFPYQYARRILRRVKNVEEVGDKGLAAWKVFFVKAHASFESDGEHLFPSSSSGQDCYEEHTAEKCMTDKSNRSTAKEAKAIDIENLGVSAGRREKHGWRSVKINRVATKKQTKVTEW